MRCMKTFFVCAMLISAFNLEAAMDPVSWSLTPATGFSNTKVGSLSLITYTLTNNLPQPAQMVVETNTKNDNFYTLDLCNNQTIAPNASCFIFTLFAPSKPGRALYELIFGYHNNRIPLPALTAVATPNTDGTQIISGSVSGLPPAFTLSNPEHLLYLKLW